MILVWLLTGLLLLLNLGYCLSNVRNDFRQARRNLAFLGMFAAAGAVLALFAVARASSWEMAGMISDSLNNF